MNEPQSQYPPLVYDDLDLQKLKDLKNKFVRGQDYETASWLRDVEKILITNIERDKEAKIKLLKLKDSFSKEDVKSLLDNAVETHEQKIIELKVKIAKNETTIKELEQTVLQTANLTLEFGEYLIKYCATYHGLVNNVPTICWRKRDDADSWDGEPNKIYTTDQIYNQFLDYKFDLKNKPNPNVDPDNGESLWVKTE
jgi:hypothetical protein